MIGRYGLALARLSIDFGPYRASGERRRHQQVIDALAEVLVEIPGAIVPSGEPAALGMLATVSARWKRRTREGSQWYCGCPKHS
jgi:hypothetical protein